MIVITKLTKDINSLWNMTQRVEKSKKNLKHVDLGVEL